ncbi:MAG: DUF4131 domain-containing protein, partial [Rhizobiales bacterium]|nr:DUF4131 domain-containing protein [Hyphomicrobiales bacterium]
MVGERGAGGRVASWPERVGARAKRAAPWIPPRFAELFDAAGRRISAWTAAEASAGRFVPWLTVAFGGGILLYFAAPREPQLWAVAGAAIVASTIAFWLRSRALGFACAALAAAIVAGFAHATINTARGGHPVLARAVFGAEVAGFVERREERERSDRITIAVTAMSGRGVTTPLQRVRVAVRKGTAPAIGSHVALKARLSPPLQPLRPGGYDFARDLYFQGIGATGFVLGKVQTRAAPGPVPMR